MSARIRGFDGLRGIAVLAVVLQHTTSLGESMNIGSYGVYIFFAISGFLIVRILHGERLEIEAGRSTPAHALRRFFWRRSLRIMPIYYLALGVFTVLAAIGLVHDFRFPDAWWHFAYVSNVYFGEVEGRWVGRFDHLWSLSVEEQFYLVAAPTLILAPSGWSKIVCAIAAAVSMAQLMIMRLGDANGVAVYTNALVNFGALAIGGLVGLSAPAQPRGGTKSWPALLCLAGIAALVWGFPLIGEVPRAIAGLVGGGPFVFSSLFASLMLAAVSLNQESRLTRWLEWGPLAGLGTVSYGLYLYHKLLPPWMLTTLGYRLGLDWRAPEALEALATLLVGLALAILSWRLVERPILGLKDRPPRLFGLGRPAEAAA